MNIPFYFARRYLFAKKSTNAINIISAISVVGVTVGTAALLIILSAFNGLESVVLKMVNTVSPEILISPAKGKTFEPGTPYFRQLKEDKHIASYTEVLAEKALAWYKDKQTPALIKGVDGSFLKNPHLDSITFDGKFVLENASGPQAVIGGAIQGYLQVNLADPFEPLQIYSPKKGIKTPSPNPMDDFTVMSIPVAGVFEVQQDFDNTIFVPLSFARELFREESKVSAIEINLNTGEDIDRFKENIKQKLGAAFEVKNRVEQNRALYHVLGSEKWMIYIILTFVLIIAIFNIIGSLTMLVIEKQKDIAVLSSLGAGKKLIKRIFLTEGMMITMLGCLAGLTIGLAFCLLQQKYGFITMGESSMLYSNAYPVSVKWSDFLLIFLTVSIFSFIASGLASNLSVKRMDRLNPDL